MTQLRWNYRFTDSRDNRYKLIECFYDQITGYIVAVAPITNEIIDTPIFSKIVSASTKPVLHFEDFKDQLTLQSTDLEECPELG